MVRARFVGTIDVDPTPRAALVELSNVSAVTVTGTKNTTGGPSPDPPDVMTVNQLASRFRSVEGAANSYMAERTPNDASDIYECGYYWEGYANAYEATGDPWYLDRVGPHIYRFINGARNVAGGFKGWINRNSSYAGTGGEYPLLESYGWRFVARLLYSMQVWGDTGSRFADWRAFTEEHIWRKWHSRSVNSHLYRQNTHMASHWAGIGMHLAAVTNNATIRNQCLTVAANIMFDGMPNYGGASIRGQMRNNRNNRDAFWFNWNWGSFAYPGSDTSHGEATVTQSIYAYELGPELQALGSPGWRAAWGQTEMDKLRVMFGQIIWPGSGSISNYVDGSGTDPWGTRGYAKLGRFNAGLQRRLENAPQMSNAWHVGNLMANARILRGGVT